MWQWKYTQSNQVWRPVKIAQLTRVWKATNLFLSPLPTWPEPVSGSLPSSACCVSGTNSHTQHSLWKLINFSHKILHRFFFGSPKPFQVRCAVIFLLQIFLGKKTLWPPVETALYLRMLPVQLSPFFLDPGGLQASWPGLSGVIKNHF